MNANSTSSKTDDELLADIVKAWPTAGTAQKHQVQQLIRTDDYLLTEILQAWPKASPEQKAKAMRIMHIHPPRQRAT